MYIARSTSKSSSGKVYQSILLRESYREGNKVKNHTIANLSKCSALEIDAIDLALKNKNNPKILSNGSISIEPGRSIGSIYALNAISERLGINKALGSSFHAKLSLWLIFARIIEQGSRLSATRLHSIYDIASILNLKRGFDENDFYESLHWLDQNQNRIEDSLFKEKKHTGQFYWYDVTSSYFEGTQNALAAYGYNRDKKKRKKQIVVGLLSINEGNPISVEGFPGNTQDTQTFKNQLDKLRDRFKCKNIILVGDRGLIRNKQKLLAKDYGYKYITALTLPEMNSLISGQHLKLENFKNEFQSIKIENARYIYRRNPGRAEETQRQRQERLLTVQKHIDKENENLKSKIKSSPYTAKKRMIKYTKRLCLFEWAGINIRNRELVLTIDKQRLEERSKYDGCYIWTTELTEQEASDQEIYDRYKDLKYVEDDFRTFKTSFLEVRPIFVRTPESTRGHLFITMLAHMIVRELRQAWEKENLTVEEGLKLLMLICNNIVKCSDEVSVSMVSKPNTETARLLKAINVTLPSRINELKVNVVTRHKTRKASK